MTGRDRTQADLLAEYIENRTAQPPEGLDAGLASLTNQLANKLTPPDPSPQFVRGLEQRLPAAPAGANHGATLPGSRDSGLAVTATGSGWAVHEPRRSRIAELARLGAAMLAIILIGSVLMLMFSDDEGDDSSGVGIAPTEEIDTAVADVPDADATPAAAPTPAPVETAVSTQTIGSDEIPDAWLEHDGQIQRGEFAFGCGWPGFYICVDPAGLLFPKDVMGVQQNAVMTFSIDGMTGDDVINLRATAFDVSIHTIDELRDTPFLMFPIAEELQLPVAWSPQDMTTTIDLPPGEYVIAVSVGLPSDSDPPVDGRSVTSRGGGTYGFHIRVQADETDNPTSFDIDPFAPAFPDAEVVHVVTEIYTESGDHQMTRVADVWIDRTTSNAVSWYSDGDGQLLTLNVRQGLTSWEFDATTSRLWITTVLEPDDPRMPDPAHPLNLFRATLQRGEEEIRNAGGEIAYDAVYDGQPAIKLVMPLSESGQVYGEVEAYVHPDTLFPIAIIGPGEDVQLYSYPTVETLDLSDVEEGLFSQEMPEADSTLINERFSTDDARAFTDIPLWWLGEEIAGYPLERIDYTLSTSMFPEQHVLILYRTSPESVDIGFQVLSQGPLSEQEEEARSHSRSNAREIEFDGNRGWVWDGTSSPVRVEIEFPDGYVTIHLSDPDMVDVALEALERLNAPE